MAVSSLSAAFAAGRHHAGTHFRAEALASRTHQRLAAHTRGSRPSYLALDAVASPIRRNGSDGSGAHGQDRSGPATAYRKILSVNRQQAVVSEDERGPLHELRYHARAGEASSTPRRR